MKRLLVLSAVAAGLVAAAPAHAIEAKDKGASPKSAVPAPAPAIVEPVVRLRIDKKQQAMFFPGALEATLTIRLPNWQPPRCGGKATFSINGKEIGEKSLPTVGTKSPDGPKHTRYERKFLLNQTWEPPAWKGGKYHLAENYSGGGPCPTATAGTTFTVVHVPTQILLTIPIPASGYVVLAPFKFEAKLSHKGNPVKPVAGASIKATVCGEAWPAQTTNANGVAAFSKMVPFDGWKPQCPNPFQLTAVFEGNDGYLKASAEQKIPWK
jgi:hypothetical protein